MWGGNLVSARLLARKGIVDPTDFTSLLAWKLEGKGSGGDSGGGTAPDNPYTWEGVAYYLNNGTYRDVYKIGDEVPLDLGKEGLINMQVAAFDADILADGSGTAAISWVAKNPPKTKMAMNATAVNADGWSASAMRTYCNNELYNMMPQEVHNIIREVSKLSDGGNANKTLLTTTDKVWLPSHTEMGVSFKYTVDGQGVTYKLFETAENRAFGSSEEWYVRSTANYLASLWVAIKPNGSAPNSMPSASNKLPFRIGFCTGKSK